MARTECSCAVGLGDFAAGVKADDQGDLATATMYRLAAERGDANAQYNLGLMYAKGEGVPEDDVQAYAWFNLAATQSDKGAAICQTRSMSTPRYLCARTLRNAAIGAQGVSG